MSHSGRSDEEIASAYLAHYRTKQDAYFWACEYIIDLETTNVERAWAITLQLINLAVDEDEMAYIAAGTLEYILTRETDKFIDRVEDLARKDRQFRAALSYVWGLNKLEPEFFERLKKFLPQV